jgi:hypothetical protein
LTRALGHLSSPKVHFRSSMMVVEEGRCNRSWDEAVSNFGNFGSVTPSEDLETPRETLVMAVGPGARLVGASTAIYPL